MNVSYSPSPLSDPLRGPAVGRKLSVSADYDETTEEEEENVGAGSELGGCVCIEGGGRDDDPDDVSLSDYDLLRLRNIAERQKLWEALKREAGEVARAMKRSSRRIAAQKAAAARREARQRKKKLATADREQRRSKAAVANNADSKVKALTDVERNEPVLTRSRARRGRANIKPATAPERVNVDTSQVKEEPQYDLGDLVKMRKRKPQNIAPKLEEDSSAAPLDDTTLSRDCEFKPDTADLLRCGSQSQSSCDDDEEESDFEVEVEEAELIEIKSLCKDVLKSVRVLDTKVC